MRWFHLLLEQPVIMTIRPDWLILAYNIWLIFQYYRFSHIFLLYKKNLKAVVLNNFKYYVQVSIIEK